MYRKKIAIGLMAVVVLAVLPAFGDDDTEVKGMIISRSGDTLAVKSAAGTTTVVLTAETTTKDDRGMLGMEKEHLSDTVLIPGLKVLVEGTPDAQGRVVAKTITTDGDDLETAEMIQSGLHPTAQQVEANMQAIEANRRDIEAQKALLAAHMESEPGTPQENPQTISAIEATTNRFSALSQYDVKGAVTLKFNTGSSEISAADQEELKKLAETATSLTGYIIEVTGYADSTGDAAMNTKLSEERAKAAIVFLMQQGNVPVMHIVAPGAMGEYGATATNETAAGRAENRRVEVKVLVNKGISGSGS